MVVASNRPRLMVHAVILPRIREAAEFVHFYTAPSAIRLSIHSLADHVAKKMLKSANPDQRALTYIGGFSESNHIHAHVYLAKENERTKFFEGGSLGTAGINRTIEVVQFSKYEIRRIESELEAIRNSTYYLSHTV